MSQTPEKDDLRSEYEFSKGVRGKHHHAYQEGTNVVLLSELKLARKRLKEVLQHG
jgi:hypothetical protein